jgi:NAD(P)-dependent dehydrogenase (short-subunit alcohol dehydrogenase family)
MNLDLSGKQALVTGSTAGIGFAAALEHSVNRRNQIGFTI